ncbi:hypothetical protein AGIG_G16699, partial [Arapaima gigas]
EGLGQREHGDVSRFAEGPVVRGEGTGQCALAQRDHKVDTPKEGEHIVDLEIEEVLLEKALCVVLDEDAPGRRAGRVGRGVKGLGGGQEERDLKRRKCLFNEIHDQCSTTDSWKN